MINLHLCLHLALDCLHICLHLSLYYLLRPLSASRSAYISFPQWAIRTTLYNFPIVVNVCGIYTIRVKLRLPVKIACHVLCCCSRELKSSKTSPTLLLFLVSFSRCKRSLQYAAGQELFFFFSTM